MRRLILLIVISVFISISCGSEESGKPIELDSAWIRPAAERMNTAVYFTLKNNTEMPIIITGASSDIAIETQVHETYRREKDLMGMRHVEHIEIPAKSKVEFKPLGYHVMLIGLKKDIALGSGYKITLQLKSGEKLTFTAVVKKM